MKKTNPNQNSGTSQKNCLVCRATNIRGEFDRAHNVTTLAQFKIAVGRIEDALSADPDYFCKQDCRHARSREDELFMEVAALHAQASTTQVVHDWR